MKVGDNVRVITGTNKGKEGKILKIFRKEGRVVIDGVNVVKKHMKPTRTNETGGILEVEAPIHISNVKVLYKETKKTEKTKEVKKAEKVKETKKEEKKEVKEKKASKKKETKESK